jgi:hypothetical protein
MPAGAVAEVAAAAHPRLGPLSAARPEARRRRRSSCGQRTL